MKTKKIAASLPLIAGIILGVIGLTLPFAKADHWIFVETTRYNVDNYLFFFWGKLYTVTGAKAQMSKMILYDFGDFPVYVMITIALALIFAAASIFAGRGLVLNVKGREFKLKLDINPLWLQIPATLLIIFSIIYLDGATKDLARLLAANNYIMTGGPAIEFLLGSIVAMTIAAIMTAVRLLRDRKDQKDKKDMQKISSTVTQ